MDKEIMVAHLRALVEAEVAVALELLDNLVLVL